MTAPTISYHRDRNLALTRPCPTCHAHEFEPCRRQRGGYRHAVHLERYRATT